MAQATISTSPVVASWQTHVDQARAVEAQRVEVEGARSSHREPARAQTAFTSSIVCVPSWKIDAASAASAPASSASARSLGPPAPPEAITGTGTRSTIARSSSRS